VDQDDTVRAIMEHSTVSAFIYEERHLSEMRDCFVKQNETNDPVIYRTWTLPQDHQGTDLLIVVTKLESGVIGSELFHTKGHFHAHPDGPEIVFGWQGTGLVELATREGTSEERVLAPGRMIWIGAGVAHRVVNPSADPLIFLSICSDTVGHDYSSVAHLNWVYPKVS
jgi:glucose-6-phosphate isomerase